MKEVMRACNLKQSDLAEVLGASLSRVKAITSGRVRNLTREEHEALISKLGIRAGWLITGEGDMFGVDETKEEFGARLRASNHLMAVINAMPIEERARRNLALCMSGNPEKDGPNIVRGLFAEFLKEGSLTAPSTLTPDEEWLLDAYRHSSTEVRAVIMGATKAAALAARGAMPEPPRRKAR